MDLTAQVSSNGVVHERHGEWASWDDLPTSAEAKSLLEKSNALVLRAKEGLKGKGASKGAKYGQLRPSHNSVSPSSPTSGASLNFQVDKPTANHMHVKSRGHSIVNH